MKKNLTLAVALLTITGMSISAASLTGRNPDAKTEKTEKSDKKDKKNDRPAIGANGKGQRLFNPFEGLDLTEEQQKQIGALTPFVVPRPPKPEEPCQGEGQACCENEKQSCCKEGVTPEQLKQAALDKLGQIKTILTPEQYQQYLENVAIGSMIQPGQDPRQGGKPGRGHRGPRGENPPAPPQPLDE